MGRKDRFKMFNNPSSVFLGGLFFGTFFEKQKNCLKKFKI